MPKCRIPREFGGFSIKGEERRFTLFSFPTGLFREGMVSCVRLCYVLAAASGPFASNQTVDIAGLLDGSWAFAGCLDLSVV